MNGYHGTAADVTGLEKVYAAGGFSCAEFFQNSFLKEVPFRGPISWHRTVRVRAEPIFISITGRVDLVVFKEKMAHKQFRLFVDETSLGQNSLARFEFAYRANGDWVILTDGSLDLSGMLKMNSSELEEKMEGDEWYHFTNTTAIDFDFSAKK